MGTGAGVVATVLVNGAAITTLVFAPKPAPGAQQGDNNGQPPPPRQMNLQIYVQDANAKQRTNFYADAQDCLFISAWVEETTEQGTAPTGQPVSFQLVSGSSWAALSPPQSSPPATVVSLKRLTADAFPEGFYVEPARVLVSASLGGNPVSIPVDIAATRFTPRLDGPEEPWDDDYDN